MLSGVEEIISHERINFIELTFRAAAKEDRQSKLQIQSQVSAGKNNFCNFKTKRN